MKKLTIKSKLTLWYMFTLLLLLGFFVPYLYLSMSNSMYNTEENTLKTDVYQAISTLDIENEGRVTSEFGELKTSGTYIYLFDLKNKLITQTGPSKGFIEISSDYDRVRYTGIQGEKWIVFDQPVYDDHQMIAWVRGCRPAQSIGLTLQNLLFAALVATPVYILLAIVGGRFIASRALSPIDKITKTALEIEHTNLKKRINLPKVEDEVGRLSAAFDEMLDRIEASFIRERQFTSDASHELRTPIAVISAHAEDTLSGEKSADELRENMAVILKESNKMAHMISQLLFLARCDEGRTRPEFEKINLSSAIGELCEELNKLASKAGVKLTLNLKEEVVIDCDQTLLTMALMNIIENAIKYNKPDGEITTELNRDSEGVIISVKDTGIGIPEDEIPRLFDRFYRVDKSRKRTGTGLGLSIVKWVIDVHKGSISIKSSLNHGTHVIIRLPVQKNPEKA